MKKYLQRQEDQCLDNEAKLIIECTADGELAFYCDWTKDDFGYTCMGSILSIIGKENTVDLIVESLERRCESEQDKEDLGKIINIYESINEIYKANEDEVIISPLEAASYLT